MAVTDTEAPTIPQPQVAEQPATEAVAAAERDLTGQIADMMGKAHHQLGLNELDERIAALRQRRIESARQRELAVQHATAEAFTEIADAAAPALTPGSWAPDREVHPPLVDAGRRYERCEWVPDPVAAPAGELTMARVGAGLAALDPQTRELHLVEPNLAGDAPDPVSLDIAKWRRETVLHHVRTGKVQVDKSRLQAAFAALVRSWRAIRYADAAHAVVDSEVELEIAWVVARRRRLEKLEKAGVA